MASIRLMRLAALVGGSAAIGLGLAHAADDPSLNNIETVVVIYMLKTAVLITFIATSQGPTGSNTCPPKWRGNSTATARH